MLRRLEETRDMTLTEIRRVIEELHREKQEQQQEQRRMQQQQQNLRNGYTNNNNNNNSSVSPGNGNWKDQSNHIAKQLNVFATQNPDFRLVHCGSEQIKKHSKNGRLIIHCPTSLGVSE